MVGFQKTKDTDPANGVSGSSNDDVKKADAPPVEAGASDEKSTQEVSAASAEFKDKQKSSKKLGKKILIPIFAFLIVVVGVLAYFFIPKSITQVSTQEVAPSQFEMKASVVYLSGEAYRIVDGRRVEIKEGDVLQESDVIETGDSSRLVLSFDEGTIVRISENTKLTLSNLDSSEIAITEDVGEIFARVEKDESHKFITYAGDVVIESVGTAFSVEKEERVTVSVYESSVVVKKEGEEDIGVDENKTWDSTKDEVEEIDRDKLATNEFIDWSLKEEKLLVPTETPAPKPTTPPVSTSGISLSGSKTDNGVYLSWTVASGIDISKGFKLVKNLTGSPSYPGGDPMKYLSDSNTRSFTWAITDGKTWHFRVCQYTGSGCGTYSNEITVTAPGKSYDKTSSLTSKINSISLAAVKVNDSTAKLTWSVDGTVQNGFKVVWSESSGPTYPPRKGDWAQWKSGETRESEIGALQAGKTYRFRVCEYLSGSCGTYSNETSLGF